MKNKAIFQDLQDLICSEKRLVNAKEFSSLALAYIGDAVFELLVRTLVLADGNAPVNRLHKKSRDIVNAKAQAELSFHIQELFTEEEKAVFRRGRNAKSFTVPKNADIMDYKHATGIEAVFGYLYLEGKLSRAIELFQIGIQKKDEI